MQRTEDAILLWVNDTSKNVYISYLEKNIINKIAPSTIKIYLKLIL